MYTREFWFRDQKLQASIGDRFITQDNRHYVVFRSNPHIVIMDHRQFYSLRVGKAEYRFNAHDGMVNCYMFS